MTKHVMAITYEPKIKPVKDGRCTQTIRKGRKVLKGDEILFHGWSGRPYRSKWDWRKRVVVCQVIYIEISHRGIVDMADPKTIHSWNSYAINNISAFDFIEPPTGVALRDVLFGLNGAPDGPKEYQIIRW